MVKTYADKKLFNYEAYEELLKKIPTSDDKELAEMVEDAVRDGIKTFTNYVKVVDDSENAIKLARFRYEGAEYRDIVQQLDRGRRISHDAAISNVNIINRCAAMFGVDKIFTGDTSDRYEVADFCLEVTVKMFENRTI